MVIIFSSYQNDNIFSERTKRLTCRLDTRWNTAMEQLILSQIGRSEIRSVQYGAQTVDLWRLICLHKGQYQK